MQALFNKANFDGSAVDRIVRKNLKGKISDDELNRITERLYHATSESSRYAEDCKRVAESNQDRIDRIRPAMIKAGLVCAALMIFALWQIFSWDMSNKALLIVECIGFCAAVLIIVFFIQNRNNPELKMPFTDHDFFDETEINKISKLLEQNPEFRAEIKATKNGNSYYALINGETVDVTKYVTDTTQNVITLEFLVIRHLEYVLGKLDGTPDAVMVETYYCLRQTGEKIVAGDYTASNEERNEIIRIYNKLIDKTVQKKYTARKTA